MNTLTTDTKARMDTLEARLTELAQRVSDLSAENERLRIAASPVGGSDGSAGNLSLSRRGLIAAAIVPAGALLVGRSVPAGAVDGDPVLAGQENTTTQTTRVVSSGGHGLDGVTTSAVNGRAGVEGKASATSGTVYGVWGKSDSVEGTGVFGEARALSGSTVGVKGTSVSLTGVGVVGRAGEAATDGTGVQGIAEAFSGEVSGVSGIVISPEGSGVTGSNLGGDNGQACGVKGVSSGSQGRGVYGYADDSSGVNYGVYGETASTNAGFALFGKGRFKATGRCFLGAPASAPPNATLTKGGISFYIDTAANRLMVRVKYPDGTLKTGSIALA